MSIVNREKISQLICGIRFEKSFRIGDIIGQIFDTVLHDRATPFGTDFFPRYQELNTQERSLVNYEKGYYLKVNSSDIIFQYSLHDSTERQNEEIEWFKNDALNFIIDKIVFANRIKNIKRFGFMISHSIDGENLGGNVLNQLTSGEIINADQFTLRFGDKDITAEGFVKSGVDDYVNKITTIKQTGEKEFSIILDYQYYFLPELNDLKDWNLNHFFEKAFYYLDKKFYDMINPLVDKMVEISWKM